MTQRVIILLSLIALVTQAAWARHVSEQQAKAEAQTFLQHKSGAVKSLKVAAKAPRMQSAVADNAFYYVFNIGDNGGFIVVSGDDRTTPILGYADEGAFDPKHVPTNMQAWLDEYEAQLKALDAMSDAEAQAAIAAPRKARTVDTRNSISPMITTKWNQASPYWNECPEFMDIDAYGDTVGEFAYTGCVATSMAQIMKYYNWPERTTKEIPSYYFSIPNGDYTYSSIEMEAQPVTTFDWAHMRDSYNGSEDSIWTKAVAHLMLYAGCAVKSQYGVSSTGAYTDDIPKGLTEYFAYDKSAIGIKFRTDFTQEAWDNLVYSELAQGRPMIYNGTAGSGGGHSFVCDGYEYGNFFHINWGWGGMGNGYFQLAVMNPRESGIGGSSSAEGYNMKQNIIIGIQPGDPEGDDPGPQQEDALTVTGFALGFTGGMMERDRQSDGFSIYKSKTFNLNYADHVGTQKRYDVGLALYNTDGTFHSMVINRGIYSTTLTSALGSFIKFGENLEVRNAVKFAAGLTGTFKVLPMYKLEGTDEWKPMLESDRFYLECVITAYTATFTVHPIVDLEAKEFTFEGGEKVGVQEQIHVTLKNNSVDRFFGNLYLWFGNQQMDDMSPYTSSIQAEVLPESEKVVTFNITPENVGTQTVRISLDDRGEKLITGSGSVTITQPEQGDMNLSVAITAENAVDNVIYDSHAHFKVDVTNNGTGEYNKFMLAPLFIVHKNEAGQVIGGDMITYSQSELSVKAGETKTYYFDFNDLAFGETYALNIYARDENGVLKNLVRTGESVYYDIKRGLVTWDGSSIIGNGAPASGDIVIPENALAARLEGLDITSVTPNANPNTIYFLGEDEKVPAGLEGHNVVNGMTSKGITLQDGYGYFVPQSVTTPVTYSRTFTNARNDGERKAWSSIVLPFTPTKVMADEQELGWFCNAEDTDKDFWIYRFAQETDSVAQFDYAEKMEANVPYIIAMNQARGMAGKTVIWSADEVILKAEPIAYTSGECYLMAGTFVKLQALENVYAIDAQGAKYVLAENATVEPFRAYFSQLESVNDGGEILLPGEEVTTIPCDVNMDGIVNVSDVTTLVNYILGINVPQFDIVAANVNNDDTINVSDVTALVNLILGSN